jgi:RNA polymerase sigma factor (sigma-70 family)
MNDLIRTVLGPGLPGRDHASSDAELLASYTHDGDHAAFARLVERHGPMVYSVCRRLLADPNDADDAFQAVFLVFIRRAGSLRGGRLAGWFYGVALRTAKEARKVSARRQRLDEKYRTTRPPTETEPADPTEADDLRAVLDRELGRLTESARAAIILCDVEGRTRKEAAAELGCPEGTLATRLARARELLASRLARLGITLGAAGLIAFLTSEARAAVPPKAKEAVLQLPAGASVAPAVLALVGKVAVGTGWLRTVIVGTALVGTIAVTGVGVEWATRPGGVGAGGDVPVAGAPVRPPAKLVPWPAPPVPQGPKTFSLVTVDGTKASIIRGQDGHVIEKEGGPPADAVFSPDGKRFVRIDRREATLGGQIHVGDVANGEPGGKWLEPPRSPVDGSLPRSLDPSWSSDGTRIIFLLDPTCSCMLPGYKGMVMSVNPATRQFYAHVTSAVLLAKPRFHPDGKRVAVLHEVAREGDRPAYDLVLHAGKDREVLLTKKPVLDYAFSPDGERVAVSVAGEGLLLLDLATHKESRVPVPIPGLDPLHDVGNLLWRPDGKVIAFRPVFVRGTKFTGKGLSIMAAPREVKNQDQVGYIHTDDPPSVGELIQLPTGFKLLYWQVDSM